MATKPKTEEQEDLLREETFAIKEMTKTKGWVALRKRIDSALEAIKNQKQFIVTEIEGRYLSNEIIARQYVKLDERASGIKAVLNEVKGAERAAEKYEQEALNKEKPKK